MSSLLNPLGLFVRLHPALALGFLGVLTVVFMGLASQVQTDVELTSFAPESDVQIAFSRVEESFGGQEMSVLIIVEAEEGDTVLSSAGLETAAAIRDAIAAVEIPDGAPEGWALAGESLTTLTYADALFGAGIDADEGDEAIRDAARAIITDEPQAAALLSQDFDPQAGIDPAAGMVVTPLGLQSSLQNGGTLEEWEFGTELSLRIAEAAEGAVAGGMAATPFNELLLNHEMETGAQDELPLLLGASLALILVILIFTFRSVTDIAIGIGGLIVAIIWTYGLGALLGPGMLGLVGPFSQIATVVPVLIVAMGIDYSIHLTSRYREEQQQGRPPRVASYRAVMTVGGALVLATITVVTGFMTNLFSPLPPLRDFGVFVTAGVISAFVVFTIGVPAIRHLLDRRHVHNRASATDAARTADTPRGFARLMGRTAVLSLRYPMAVFAVALVVTVLSAGAATRIPTTFAITDFIPADSRAATAIATLEDRFGGDLTERTYILVEGDLRDPVVANAIIAVEARLGEVDDVQQVNGDVAALSPASVVALSAVSAPDEAAVLGWTGEGFADDSAMAELYALAETHAPAELAQVLTADHTLGLISIPTVAGQEEVEALNEQLRALTGPLDEAGVESTVTSQFLVLQEALDALTATQARGIVITLAAAAILLTAFYGLSQRRPLIGVVTILPSILVTTWVLGTMWLLGISFNVLTAMVSALAIGIGVPFGIHVAHRFLEELDHGQTVDEAVSRTVTRTGGALAGSAATTAAGFGVLGLSSLAPIQQFGMIVALVIVYSFIAATIVEPALLRYWATLRGYPRNSGSSRAKMR